MRPDRRLDIDIPGAGRTALGEATAGRKVTVWCRLKSVAGADADVDGVLVDDTPVTAEARYQAALVGRQGLRGRLDGRGVDIRSIQEDVTAGRMRRRWMLLTLTYT